MAKNTMLNQFEEKELDDEFHFLDSPDDEMMAGLMEGLIESSNHQMLMAIELTKLIVSKNANQNMTDEHVFSSFKRASKVIAENFPLKELFEKLR